MRTWLNSIISSAIRNNEVYSALMIWKKLEAKKKKLGCKTVRFPGSIFVKNIFVIYMNLQKKNVHEFKGKGISEFSATVKCFCLIGNAILIFGGHIFSNFTTKILFSY